MINVNIYGFGEVDDEDYISVETDEGIEKFKTLLLRLYHTILYKDPNWHYFIEGKYNHLRFSHKFWEEIKDMLDLHEVNYHDLQQWINEQGITREYQDIFQNMNHQTIFLPEHCKKFGTLMEPSLVANYASGRAHYIGRIEESNAILKSYNDRLAEYKKESDKIIDNLTEKHEELLLSEEVNK